MWNTEIGRNAFQAGRWAISARLVGGLGRLLRSLVLARLLAPAEFGLAALAIIAIETLDTCTAPGLEPALVQRSDQSRADIDRAFTIQLARAVCVALLAWYLAPLIANGFREPRLVFVVRWLTLVPLLRGLTNPGTVELVRRLRFGRLFFWEAAEVCTAVTAGVAMALARPDVTALIVSVLAAQGVRTALSWAIVPERARVRLDVRRSGELLRYGNWVLAANVLMLLNVQGEHALVGSVFGPAALGIYQMGGRIAELPITLLGYPLVQVAFPALTHLRDEKSRFVSLYSSIGAGLFFACVAWLAFMGPLASLLVRNVLGEAWIPSVPILRIMLVTTLVRGIVVFGQAGFYALGRPDLHVRVNLVRLLAMVTMLPFLVGPFGLRGVAASVLGGTGVAAVAQALLLRRQLRGETSASLS